MSALRTLIWGPRPLRPRLLKAMAEISVTPMRDYLNILNQNYTLHVKSTKGETVELKLDNANYLFQLLELQSFGIKFSSYDPDQGLIFLNLYGDAFCIRPKGYHIEGLLHMFRDKIYGEDFQDAYVLDIGAFTGDSAISFAKWGARKVVAIEPSPSVLDILKANLNNSRFRDKIDILPVAVSDYDGSTTLLINESLEGAEYLSDFHGSSFYDKIFNYDSKNFAKVDTWSFKHLIEYTGGEVDIVKLDCKGAEYPILLNTEADILRLVKRYIVAYHAGPERLVARLEELGYETRIQPAAPGHEHLFPTAGTLFADRQK